MKNKQRNTKPRIVARFIATVLIAALSVNGYYAYNIFGGEVAGATNYKGMNDEQIALQQEREAREQAQEESEYLSYTPDSFDDINTVIVDENDAEALFSELRYDMNLFDISDTFALAYSRSNEYFDVYTMKQYHDGIEVYGHEIKMTVDKSGNLLSVDGNPANLEGFDTAVTIDESEAYEYVEKYLKSEYQLTAEDVSIQGEGKCIFLDAVNAPAMGYLFEVAMPIADDISLELYRIMMCGNEKKVAFVEELMQSATRSMDLQGQEVIQTLDVDISEDGETYLIDSNRSLGVFDSKDNSLEYTEQLCDADNPGAVDMLANVQRAYDFYEENFGFHKDKVYLFVDNAAQDYNGTEWYNDGINGRASRGANGENYGIISLTRDKSLSIYLDAMAHEYSHIMFPDNISANTPINEGLADLFGELTEDYSDGGFNNSCNWFFTAESVGSRNIKDPHDSGLAQNILDIENAKTSTNNGKTYYALSDFSFSAYPLEYYASTIVSHSAYLMTQGINSTQALTNEELARLYYNSLNKLPAGCTFEEFRKHIEATALAMNQNTNSIGPLTMAQNDSVKKSGQLTDSQWESVVDAFDRVGIERSYNHSLINNAEIQVIDVNNKPYNNYHLKITKKNDGKVVVDQDVKKKKYTLPNLDKGVYEFELTDLKNDKDVVIVSVIINDNVEGQLTENYKDKANILTNFGSLNKEVALVLDVSGSMEGEPIAQTKQAALNFVETVFKANPNICVTLITYSDSSNLLLESCNNEALLCGTIMGLHANGGTEMFGAISTAESVLNDKDVEDKYVIVMSDGNPSDSPALAANSIKENDIILCSLGFYHSSDEGAGLMQDIASPGYYYNVKNVADIQGVFDEIARQVSGEEYSIRRIACPVDVIVSYNGETLCSAEKNQNLRTSFGSISFEGENNEVKILRLDDKANYEVCIYGTGRGTMDYTVSYVDKNGEYSDVRNFERVPINRKTVIVSNAVEDSESILRIDSDGDGRFDLQYTGNNEEEGEPVDSRPWLTSIFISGIFLVLWLIIEIILLVRRFKKNHTCANCGIKKIKRGSKFCSECGGVVNDLPLLPKFTKPVGKQKVICIIQTVLVVLCVGITILTTAIYYSSANTVFLQLRNSELVSAEMMYENGVQENKLSCLYLSAVTDIYLNRVEKAYGNARIGDDEVKFIYQTVADMDMGKASDSAKNKLKSLSALEQTEDNES